MDYKEKSKSILIDKDLTSREKIVLLYILNSEKGDNPSRSQISYELDINNTTLGKCLKGLERKNYININHNRQKGLFSPNSYTLAKG